MEKKELGVVEEASAEEKGKFLETLKKAGKIVVAFVSGLVVDGPLGAAVAAAGEVASYFIDNFRNEKTAEMGA